MLAKYGFGEALTMERRLGRHLALTLKVAGWATVAEPAARAWAWAWLLARKRFFGRELLDAVLTLPMVMPPTVLGYYLLVLIGRRGPLGEWLSPRSASA